MFSIPRDFGKKANGVSTSPFPVALLFLAVPLFLSGCTSSLIDSIQVTPSSQSIATGQTVQFTATGIIGHGAHPSSSVDVTSQVSWTSSAPSVATVNAGGLATAVSAGTTTITASMSGFGGIVSTSSSLTVTNTSSGGGGGGVTSSFTSLTLIPGSQSVASPGETAQFIAIGSTSTGSTVNLSSQVVWTSSSAQIATIGASTGLATAVGQGTATITALYNSNGTTLTASASMTVQNASNEKYTSLQVIPNAQSVSASGQTGQFVALASGPGGLEVDVTASPSITWKSSVPTVASISSTGLVTGVSAGTTTISALLTNPDNSVVSATATVTATLTPAPEPLLSLTIIPDSLTVGNLQDTGQFLAIGTYSLSPTVRDLTNSVTWLSSFPSVFPVNSNGTGVPNPGTPAGVVTAYGNGGAVIIAEATDPTTGSIQTATATFNCPLVLPNPPNTPGSCYPGSQAAALLATLTIYNEGLNTTGWLVTAPSATTPTVPNVLHCGPGSSAAGLGGSVCVATYPVNSTITVTAPAEPGVTFGGWSSNCTNTGTVTSTGPNTCTVTLTTNDTVGAVFN
jgi:uncharacterized protein YjdB